MAGVCRRRPLARTDRSFKWFCRRLCPVRIDENSCRSAIQVHGNVFEWVEDCFNETYKGAPADGSAWIAGNRHRRVLRGGSFESEPGELRAANRIWYASFFRYFTFGFRVARTLRTPVTP